MQDKKSSHDSSRLDVVVMPYDSMTFVLISVNNVVPSQSLKFCQYQKYCSQNHSPLRFAFSMHRGSNYSLSCIQHLSNLGQICFLFMDAYTWQTHNFCTIRNLGYWSRWSFNKISSNQVSNKIKNREVFWYIFFIVYDVIYFISFDAL